MEHGAASPGPLVLLVDDDDDIRETLRYLLEDEGFQVREARNGLEGLGAMRIQPPPDIVVLDLMMPVMSGWEFRDRQRGDPRLAAIPVIVMSAIARSAPPGRLEALGAVEVLAKPLDLDHLLTSIAAKGFTAAPHA